MWKKRLRWIARAVAWALAVAVLVGAAWGLLWHLPRSAAAKVEDPGKQAEIENAYRATGAQLFLGLGLFAGVILTYRRIRAVERQAEAATRQARAAEDGQITERFTRAIEQLGTAGDEAITIRLGGIYALERIMRDSAADATTVREVLAAFVREKATFAGEEARGPRIDVQAAMTVLGRNWLDSTAQPFPPLDLTGVDLREADLRSAHLERTDFSEAHLEKAHLSGAHLSAANFASAHLAGAILVDTKLKGASFLGADLTGAVLRGADMRGAVLIFANLSHVNLTKTNLLGVDLTDAMTVGARLPSHEDDS